MDISYLLFLQNLREATHDLFSPFLIWISNFSVGFWPVAMACMVYWVFDRKAGKRILAGFGLGVLMNGFLKLTFRITRPWLRDARVVPYGDSITTATGYSFPSGHSTFATSLYGGIAWWQRKRSRVLCGVFLAAMLLLYFSRNYLGVHTPQDVLVACIATILMMIAANKIEDWTDRDIRRDWIVMAVGLLVCVGLVVYYGSITIEEVYDATGALVVDPAKMRADSFEGIGSISTFVVCRFFARRYFPFETRLSKKDRFIICTFALVPLYWWCMNILTILEPISRALGRFATHAGIMVYALIIVPCILSRIRLPKWMKEPEAEAAAPAQAAAPEKN